jgi:hypothetical protein
MYLNAETSSSEYKHAIGLASHLPDGGGLFG